MSDVARPRQSQGRVPQVDLEGEDVRAGSIGRLTSKDLPRFDPSSWVKTYSCLSDYDDI